MDKIKFNLNNMLSIVSISLSFIAIIISIVALSKNPFDNFSRQARFDKKPIVNEAVIGEDDKPNKEFSERDRKNFSNGQNQEFRKRPNNQENQSQDNGNIRPNRNRQNDTF